MSARGSECVAERERVCVVKVGGETHLLVNTMFVLHPKPRWQLCESATVLITLVCAFLGHALGQRFDSVLSWCECVCLCVWCEMKNCASCGDCCPRCPMGDVWWLDGWDGVW